MKSILLSIAMSASLSTIASEHTDTAGIATVPLHMLDNLDVVAVKQQADPRTMAVSATLIGSREKELNDVVDIKSMSDMVPNFFIPDYGSRITSSIYVRGIGARMDQPAVALNIDNLPVMNKDAYDLDLPDIEGVEMIRGPQSNLFGRNAMGGLINIRTLSPMRWQGIRAKAEIASGNTLRLSAGWYRQWSGTTGFSVSASFLNRGGRFRNLYNGKKIDKERSGGIRTKFEWQPGSLLSLSNTLSAGLLRQGGYPYEYVPTGEINYNDTCFYRRATVNDALTLRLNFPGVTLTSITSVQHLDDNMTLDQDFLPLPYFTLTQKKQETVLTEDLLARGLGSGCYQWLAGAFAFYRHLDMQAPVNFGDKGISSLIEEHRNEANPVYPIAWDSRAFTLDSDFTMPSYGVAIYHESRVNLGSWQLTASLRLDYERVDMDYRSQCATGYTILHKPATGVATPYHHVDIDINDSGRLSTDFLTLLPRASVLYDLPGDAGNVYATFGKGYKAGGFNTQMFSDVLQQRLMGIMGMSSRYDIKDIVTYKPEYSFNYEIGAHLSPLPDLTADLSLFYIDCRDQQLTMFPDGTTTGRIMTNAGKTRSCGFEISASWTPDSWFSLTASYGHTNARFVRFFDGLQDHAGKRVPYAPSNTLFVQPVFSIRTSSLRNNCILIDASLRGVGKIYWNEENTLWQPFYMRLGAGVTFQTPRWNVRLWGTNLTDTRFHTFYFMSMGNEFLQRGEGIAAGISAEFLLNS